MLHTMQRLGNTGEVIYYYPVEGITILAYIVNVLPKDENIDIYFLYSENRLVSVQL